MNNIMKLILAAVLMTSTANAKVAYNVWRMPSTGNLPTWGAIDISQSAAVTGILANANTTATSANTNSAIVARDGSGNFSAGTISAALTGNASTSTALAANPSDCAGGTFATTIAANGNLTCAAIVLTTDVSGTLPIANGGTGQVTAAAAFGALSPLTTKGDVLGYSTLNARIPVGANGEVLTADSTQALGVKWASAGAGSFVSQTSATGEAQLPGGTTGQRAGSPANGDVRKNTTTGTIEFYNNGHYFPLELGFDTATNSQTFTATGAGTLTVAAGVTKMSVIIVGAGGGGGAAQDADDGTCGGGGGGGTVTYLKNIDVIPGSVIKTYVGVGGAGGLATSVAAERGQSSYFGGFSAIGGSGGNGAGANGVNGAGNGGGQTVGLTTITGFLYNSLQSSNLNQNMLAIYQTSFGFFTGGTGTGAAGTSEVCGGGAGASVNGTNAAANGGNGGTGLTINGIAYGGGGGGGIYTGTAGSGGTGGGGAGGANAVGTAGTANTGGGGGGSGTNTATGNNGAAGGSGKIIAYWYL